MEKYEYMVIYSFNNGMGRLLITAEKPILTYDDVENLDKSIRKCTGFNTAFVTDFKLLRKYQE